MELAILTAVVFGGLITWMFWEKNHQNHPQKH